MASRLVVIAVSLSPYARYDGRQNQQDLSLDSHGLQCQSVPVSGLERARSSISPGTFLHASPPMKGKFLPKIVTHQPERLQVLMLKWVCSRSVGLLQDKLCV
uniref:Uncharacterized protein n=1 Tax=Oryza meridionalis TaxID=40149 RepID=A0A0E0BYR9_9ORYZ